ncbi:MAG TPA: hypothetical protein VHW23_17335 [Kofleriaceae bacterium]|nr:hypothetical protein [Kofleriaceae bacterium]
MLPWPDRLPNVGISRSPVTSGMSGTTLHAGARAAAALRLGSAFWLDAGLECEAVQIGTTYATASPLGAALTNPFLHRWRLEVGLQWAP